MHLYLAGRLNQVVDPNDQPVLLLDPLSSLDVDHLVEVELLLVGVLGPIDHSGTILLSQGQSLKLPKKRKIGMIMIITKRPSRGEG